MLEGKAKRNHQKSKYENPYFWENIVRQDRFHSLFADDVITRKTVFFYGIIINRNGVGYEKWLQFPSDKALLGFLSYVFLPAVFFTSLSGINDVRIPHLCLDGVVDLFGEYVKLDQKVYMRELGRCLNQLWDHDPVNCIEELKKISKGFNYLWSKRYSLFSYFEVFKTPIELGNYLVDSYERWEGVDVSVLEAQLGLPREEWLRICSQVYESEFMKRSFVGILNNRISEIPMYR